ncbi:MAG: LCP family protein [Clostridiales bacterium]|nr:LCP family protein [Clostridiales bacterium]
MPKAERVASTLRRALVAVVAAALLLSLTPVAQTQAASHDNPLIHPKEYKPLQPGSIPVKKEFVNILLLGFDADYKSYAQDGGDSHTDAMMVVSISTTDHTISLISLPRDTLTYVPGIRGIYKLNGAVNAGGGKNEDGLLKACQSVSVLLGNVPIDYYFGIDMDMIPKAVDHLGGVDLNVAIPFSTQSGKRYSTGMKHLDGEAVYSYMRARKSAEGTDKARTRRQRSAIAAILHKIQQEKLFLKLPQILLDIQGGYYTNISPTALLPLLPLAMNADVKTMKMVSMEGSLRVALNDWNIHFVNQEARRDLIEDIFGIDVQPLRYSSYSYCQWLVGNGQAGDGALGVLRYLYVTDQVLEYALESADPAGEIAPARQAVAELRGRLEDAFCETSERVDRIKGSYKTDPESVKLNREMNEVKEQLYTAVKELAEKSGFPGDSGKGPLGQGDLRWAYPARWETDPAINEVYVNFH